MLKFCKKRSHNNKFELILLKLETFIHISFILFQNGFYITRLVDKRRYAAFFSKMLQVVIVCKNIAKKVFFVTEFRIDLKNENSKNCNIFVIFVFICYSTKFNKLANRNCTASFEGSS